MFPAKNKTYMYKRVLLKLSGESLGGPQGKGIDEASLNKAAAEIAAAVLHGMRDLPGSGTEPISPALAGGFFTTGESGSPRRYF